MNMIGDKNKFDFFEQKRREKDNKGLIKKI